MTRVYFATDVHGSERVWRKWLSVPSFHKADILILAGDLTGKAIAPIVKKSDGSAICNVFGRDWRLKTDSEIRGMEERIRSYGYYPYVCTVEEFRELEHDEKKVDALLKQLMVKRIEDWLSLLIEKVDLRKTRVVVMPGNDDETVIDSAIRSYEDSGVIYPLDKVTNLLYDFEMISLDYSNPTPWKTPRECSEDELEKKIRDLFSRVSSYAKTICNFHCPPANTKLDLAPKLDKNLKPVTTLTGSRVMAHVGSEAVRKTIREYQPMIGLHGHIHESFASDKIGKTPVLNPGSEYTEGILRGFIAEFSESGVDKYWKVEG